MISLDFGGKKANMQEIHRHLIETPSNYLPSLNGTGFSWVLEPSWSPDQQRFFADTRGLEFRRFFSKSSQDTNTKFNSLKALGKWVLEESNTGEPGSPLAWAECQGLFGTFSIMYLFLGGCQKDNFWDNETGIRSLAQMITAISISFGADEIRIFAGSDNEMRSLKRLNWGQSSKFWSPRSHEIFLAGDFSSGMSEQIIIDSRQWSKSKFGISCHKDLSYLLRRKIRQELKDCGCDNNAPAKRSMLARLFRPKI